VREVEEETGQVITLGVPLTTQRYRLGGGQTKEVHYWVGTPLPADDPATRLRAPVARAPRTEIDQTTWATPEAAADMLTRRGDRRLLADLVARTREGRLATSTIIVLRPGAADAVPIDAASAAPVGGRASAPGMSASGGTALGSAPTPGPGSALGSPSAPTVPDGPGPRAAAPSTAPAAPTPAMVASAAARRAAQVERASSLTAKAAAHPADPPLGRFGVRQSFDLIDLLSAFGVGRAFASPSARARQVLAPWAAVGGGSVTLVEALGVPVGDEAGADKDADARAGRVRAFAAQRLREQAGATLLSVTGAARDLIVEEIRAYGSSAIVGASPVSLGHGQIMVAHVEQGSDGPVVVAVETHSVTTKNPAVPTRKASRRR
jgi:mutT1